MFFTIIYAFEQKVSYISTFFVVLDHPLKNVANVLVPNHLQESVVNILTLGTDQGNGVLMVASVVACYSHRQVITLD